MTWSMVVRSLGLLDMRMGDCGDMEVLGSWAGGESLTLQDASELLRAERARVDVFECIVGRGEDGEVLRRIDAIGQICLLNGADQR